MHISIIEDEKILAGRIKKKLEAVGYSATEYHWYQEFMRYGNARSELYIIDISLWDGNGFDIIDWLRNSVDYSGPIIIISWYGNPEKVIHGLNIWADDYLGKLFLPDELIARIRALLRRPANFIKSDIVHCGGISYDPETKEVKVEGTRVILSHKEALILEMFLRKPKSVITREDMVVSVWWWAEAFDVSDNTINVTLSKLRRKIWPDFALRTLYNEWYIFEPQHTHAETR